MIKFSLQATLIASVVLLSACRPAQARMPAAEVPYESAAPTAHTPIQTIPTANPSPVVPSPTPPGTSLPAPIPSATADPPRLTSTEVPTTTLLFTGVIVPARCVQAALDAKDDPDYPYEEVRSILQTADLAVGTFNATMSHRVEHTGCVDTYQLVGSPRNADALQRAGFDLVSVATNHIKDCGLMKSWCNETFSDTLDNLRRVGIPYVGAGKDLDEALQPVVITVNGIRFGFVALGDSKMVESVFATDTNPGIAYLSESNLRAAIASAQEMSDVVIALPHWGSENNLVPNWNQRTQARQLVEAGADLIVGNHTHVVQAIQTLEQIPVFFGLGNFVFDQGPRINRQGVILLVKFKGMRYVGYELIPTHVDRDGRVHVAGPEEALEILENIRYAGDMLE